MREKNKTRSLYFSDRVSGAMERIFDYPLTVVEAPMGYGKTTAVREHVRNARANVLWLKVYSGSITDFWNGLCGLLGEADSDRSQSLAQLGFPNDRVSLQEALKLVECMELPEKTVLCIDDYHLLNETEAGSFIEYLVVNEISNLHIVLIARYIKLAGLEELSLKDYLFHITKEAFELMPSDIAKYYKLCGIGLKKGEAEKLYSVTEGWISALYLLMLNYKEKGGFTNTEDIYKLVESAIYTPFSEESRDFLLKMSIFDNFSRDQAVHIWGSERAEYLLAEIVNKNAFVNYDAGNRSYLIHNIFTNFLQETIEKRDINYRQKLYQKAGDWYERAGEYLTAMRYYHAAGDFNRLLSVVELDRGNSFGNERKEEIIKYFEECPEEIKRQHIPALFVYAMALMTFNEMEKFGKICGEIAGLIRSGGLDRASADSLTGELELLLSFTRYNDIAAMSEHHKRACALLKKPSVFMASKGSWTFGSPSVLYMFYRESGKLEQEIRDIKEAMPYYYRLTNGHGMGAESVMEAERHFNTGDFENAEIAAHKALLQAREGNQPNLVICAQFLLVRLALLKGDYASVLDLFTKMREEIERNKVYVLIHTMDICLGFVHACLQQDGKVPEWLAEGDFNSNRLYFPSRAFSNIIYGRVLLLKGEYLKLLGTAGHLMGIASVFPNILAKIYTAIDIAAANEKLFRRGEAIEAVRQALDMATPDGVYMPFVENCDYIKPLLDELYTQNIYRKDIAKILKLHKPYQKAIERIKDEYFMESKPKLTEREAEIAQLAAEGYSNKVIGERLFISTNTVKTQLKSVFEKIGINSRSLLKQYFEANL